MLAGPTRKTEVETTRLIKTNGNQQIAVLRQSMEEGMGSERAAEQRWRGGREGMKGRSNEKR